MVTSKVKYSPAKNYFTDTEHYFTVSEYYFTVIEQLFTVGEIILYGASFAFKRTHPIKKEGAVFVKSENIRKFAA